MNPLRSLRIYRCRREFQPPAGTTHVLDYMPAGECWELTPLDIWLAGEFRREYLVLPGPASMTEEDFGQHILDGPAGPVDLGEAAFLGGFEASLAAPAFWVQVAS